MEGYGNPRENPVIRAILERRSIRSFQDRPVPAELLDTVLLAGQYAPSGSNSQSCHFAAVVDGGLRQALNRKVKAALGDMDFAPTDYPAKLAAKRRSGDEAYHFFYNAPAFIIVSNVEDYTNAMADSAAAIQNMLLAAHALGLASCWINQLTWVGVREEIRAFLGETFGVPLNHRVCGGVALGFPEGKAPRPAPRKSGIAIW